MDDMPASILVVANPAAGNGTGTQAARRAVGEFEAAIAGGRAAPFLAGVEVDAAFLSSADQTRSLIEGSADRRAIVAVGGDGLVHLVANALMAIAPERRPALAVVPAGTGNDYARALGLPLDLKRSVHVILQASPRPVDLGL